jgi:hypothetical protein
VHAEQCARPHTATDGGEIAQTVRDEAPRPPGTSTAARERILEALIQEIRRHDSAQDR